MSRGHSTHNHTLLDPFEELGKQVGAEMIREFPTKRGRSTGYIDLLLRYQGETIAIEAELTTRRVGNDVRKEVEVRADLLLIVFPTHKLAASARRKLKTCRAVLELRKNSRIWCLPLGVALSRLTDRFDLLFLYKLVLSFSS